MFIVMALIGLFSLNLIAQIHGYYGQTVGLLTSFILGVGIGLEIFNALR